MERSLIIFCFDSPSWWMRGLQTIADAPATTEIVQLPVGRTTMLEIACNGAFTSFYGNTGNIACPNSTQQRETGPYHSSIDPVSHYLTS
jgi:hypothetical protein